MTGNVYNLNFVYYVFGFIFLCFLVSKIRNLKNVHTVFINEKFLYNSCYFLRLNNILVGTIN